MFAGFSFNVEQRSRHRRQLVLGLLGLALSFALHWGGIFGMGAVAGTTERILNYESDITVETDGSLTVAEDITFNVQGDAIKRGIYRDFPLTSPFHNNSVTFEVLDVERNGEPTHYWTENLGNEVRINIYKEDEYLDPGTYAYTIRYHTNNQLDFSGDRDRLYWNVTGQDWTFAIDHVTATVHLPEDIPRNNVTLRAYVGRQGEKGQSYEARIDDEGNLFFETTRALALQEGLSIDVSFPTGHVTQYDLPQSSAYGWMTLFFVLLGLISTTLFALFLRFALSLQSGIDGGNWQSSGGSNAGCIGGSAGGGSAGGGGAGGGGGGGGGGGA